MAQGYLNAPQLTADKFIANPFSRVSGARLYRTGDLVRYLPDGNLDFLGRLDHQVKVRGFRIELSEIEWTLAQHPDVREAVAVARDESDGSKTLVAYVVAEATGEPTAPELRSFLKQSLPDHMVPPWIVRLDALPRTPNDKLDRAALPAPATVAEPTPGARPMSPTVTTIIGIWCEVLGLTRIDPDADFFTIGGDSLKAVRCVSQINHALASDLSLREFWEHPTVAGVASVAVASPVDQVVTGIPRRGHSDPCALSSGQKRIWFLDRLEPDSPKYNIIQAFRWTGPLDRQVLARSLSFIVERHESLRTTYHDVAGRPVQVVAEESTVQVPFTDLRELSANRREAELEHQIHAAAARPFDLSRDLALRAEVWQLEDQKSVVLINIHHIASDGWSFNIVGRELADVYEGLAAGRSPLLPDLPIQYSDFAVWQSQQMRPERLEAGLTYWQRRLSGPLEPLVLPSDQPHPDATDFRGRTATLSVPSTLLTGLQELSERSGVTVFTIVAAGFQTLLGRLSGQTDIAIGAPMAAREQLECEGLIGLFTNTVVLRLDLSGDPTFEALLQQAREMVLGAVTHQSLPFDKVVHAVNPSREHGHNPLFDVMLEFNTQPWNTLRIRGARIEPLLVSNPLARFAMTLHVNEREGGLHLRALYRQAVFSKKRIDRMLRQFVGLLEAAVADTATPISQLHMTPTRSAGRSWRNGTTRPPTIRKTAVSTNCSRPRWSAHRRHRRCSMEKLGGRFGN